MNILTILYKSHEDVYPIIHYKLSERSYYNYTCLPSEFYSLVDDHDVVVLDFNSVSKKLKDNPLYTKQFDKIYIAIDNEMDTDAKSVTYFIEDLMHKCNLKSSTFNVIKNSDLFNRLSTYSMEQPNGLIFYDRISGYKLEDYTNNVSKTVYVNVLLCKNELYSTLKDYKFKDTSIWTIDDDNPSNLAFHLEKDLYIINNKKTTLRQIKSVSYIDAYATTKEGGDTAINYINNIYIVNSTVKEAEYIKSKHTDTIIPVYPVTIFDTYNCIKNMINDFNNRVELMKQYKVNSISLVPLMVRLKHNIQNDLYIFENFDSIMTILSSLNPTSINESVYPEQIRESIEKIRKYGYLYGILCCW